MRRTFIPRQLFVLCCFFVPPALNAALPPTCYTLHPLFQRAEDPLSQKEIEELRDTNRLPNERVMAFIKFMDERTESIRKLTTGPRRPGREQDIHDTLEQFTAIADNLEDNLNEYGPRHRDNPQGRYRSCCMPSTAGRRSSNRRPMMMPTVSPASWRLSLYATSARTPST